MKKINPQLLQIHKAIQNRALWSKISLFLIIFFLIAGNANAQFYNGLQMEFGKNRVQYREFVWSFYRFDKFDVYFTSDGQDLAVFAAETALNKIKEVEEVFDYNFEKRIIFILYNKLSDFRQSNIGLGSIDEKNIGGVTRIIGNKVFIYYENDHPNFEKQITEAVAEIVMNAMLYGSSFRDRMSSSALLNLPPWYLKGLQSYIANDWNFEIENEVKDGILSNKYKRINWLKGQEAVYAGHSIWRYIAETYGKSVIPNILYITKINRDYNKGFSFVIGTSLKGITPAWLDFYKSKYMSEKFNPVPDSLAIKEKKKHKKKVHCQIRLSPDEKYLAYTTNDLGRSVIWLYDIENQKHTKLTKKGHKLEQIPDYSQPIIAWHPSGEALTILMEDEGTIKLLNYYVKTKKFETRSLVNEITGASARRLLYFEKILDFKYDKTGLKMVMSAVKDGQTDIFVFNLVGNAAEQITNDIADDLTPSFSTNGNEIIFSSNRLGDTLVKKDKNLAHSGDTYDLFVFDYKTRSGVLRRLSSTSDASELSPVSFSRNQFAYLSDQNGIVNRYIAKYDSTVSHIDTLIHYRYFTVKQPATNYFRNIIDMTINPNTGTMAELFKYNQKYHINITNQPVSKINQTDTLSVTSYRKQMAKNQINEKKRIEENLLREKKRKNYLDSLRVSREREIAASDTLKANVQHPDSTLININNYAFESAKNEATNIKKTNIPLPNLLTQNADTFILPHRQLYFTNFYVNYLVSQLDFSFLNASYQTFTGGEVYFNPGTNAMMKIGTQDLFEDYKLTAGFGAGLSFDNYEFLVSVENLKFRWDKQYVFHRMTFMDTVNMATGLFISNEAFYILRYPFSQVSAIKLTSGGRFDKIVVKSEDYASLNMENTYRAWANLKFEYIFDNTFDLGLNLRSGRRYKIFGEFYHQVDKWKTDLFVVGADFRHYIPLHRNLILAHRFAASTSFGHNKLIYYLGSVDNWVNISRKYPTFDQTVDINHNYDYVFQTVATNMRGFTQNIRNGNSFAVMNTEIRLPIFNYLYNRPINSDFFNNFQIAAFFDIGSAWSGLTPNSPENEYNRQIIDGQGSPITIIIDRDRAPFVMGYGFGVRSRFLGYFMRLDWARGIEGDVILPRIFYLSLSMDF